MSNENDWFNVGRNRINLGGGQYNPHVEGDSVQGQRIEGDYVKGQRINVDPSDPSQSSQAWGWVDDLKDAMRGMGVAFQQGNPQRQQETSNSGWTEYTDDYGNHTINTNGGNYCEHINGDVIQGSVIGGRVVNGNYYNVGSNTSWGESSSDSDEWNTVDVEASNSPADNDGGFLERLWG